MMTTVIVAIAQEIRCIYLIPRIDINDSYRVTLTVLFKFKTKGV